MKSKYGLRPPPRAFLEAGDKAQVHLTIASATEYIDNSSFFLNDEKNLVTFTL